MSNTKMEQLNQYILTSDELALVADHAAVLASAQAAFNSLLSSIIRVHKLGDGQWYYDDGKLTKRG